MSQQEDIARMAERLGATPVVSTLLPFACPACGHVDTPPPGPHPKESVFRCDECRNRIAYGVAMPRIVVTPDEEDSRFVLLIFETMQNGAKTTVMQRVDRQYGNSIALNLASICR